MASRTLAGGWRRDVIVFCPQERCVAGGIGGRVTRVTRIAGTQGRNVNCR